jgi:hypothetical protein
MSTNNNSLGKINIFPEILIFVIIAIWTTCLGNEIVVTSMVLVSLIFSLLYRSEIFKKIMIKKDGRIFNAVFKDLEKSYDIVGDTKYFLLDEDAYLRDIDKCSVEFSNSDIYANRCFLEAITAYYYLINTDANCSATLTNDTVYNSLCGGIEETRMLHYVYLASKKLYPDENYRDVLLDILRSIPGKMSWNSYQYDRKRGSFLIGDFPSDKEGRYDVMIMGSPEDLRDCFLDKKKEGCDFLDRTIEKLDKEASEYSKKGGTIISFVVYNMSLGSYVYLGSIRFIPEDISIRRYNEITALKSCGVDVYFCPRPNSKDYVGKRLVTDKIVSNSGYDVIKEFTEKFYVNLDSSLIVDSGNIANRLGYTCNFELSRRSIFLSGKSYISYSLGSTRDECDITTKKGVNYYEFAEYLKNLPILLGKYTNNLDWLVMLVTGAKRVKEFNKLEKITLICSVLSTITLLAFMNSEENPYYIFIFSILGIFNMIYSSLGCMVMFNCDEKLGDKKRDYFDMGLLSAILSVIAGIWYSSLPLVSGSRVMFLFTANFIITNFSLYLKYGRFSIFLTMHILQSFIGGLAILVILFALIM